MAWKVDCMHNRRENDDQTDQRTLEGTLCQDLDSVDRSRESSMLMGKAPAAVPGFRILQSLGEGKYGSVWLAREQNTGNTSPSSSIPIVAESIGHF